MAGTVVAFGTHATAAVFHMRVYICQAHPPSALAVSISMVPVRSRALSCEGRHFPPHNISWEVISLVRLDRYTTKPLA